MLELAVEATYPICEALTVSLISVSASIQGVTIMELDHYLSKPISQNTTITNDVSYRINYNSMLDTFWSFKNFMRYHIR